MKKQQITYSQTGVNYEAMDPVKVLAQLRAKETAKNLKRFGMAEVSASRGESAYIWEEPDAYRSFVIEGLGTKNLVADEVRKFTGKTHYDAIAQDTIAMVVNDLIVLGADPQVINAYFAVGDSAWFSDKERAKDLVEGWARGCKLSGAVWGGGETPTLKGIIDPKTIDLGGSAVGIISPKERLALGSKLKAGDAIVLIESSGIHANGLTLARAIASKVPKGYQAKLSDGTTYGAALLQPTHIYAKLVQSVFAAGIMPHYMVNITGHGWRKLMRANKKVSYVFHTVPPVSPLFSFIQEHSSNDDYEMYGNFNMGAGYAFFVSAADAEMVVKVARKNKLQAWNAGVVRKGDREVIIEPKGITYTGETLQVRL